MDYPEVRDGDIYNIAAAGTIYMIIYHSPQHGGLACRRITEPERLGASIKTNHPFMWKGCKYVGNVKDDPGLLGRLLSAG